MSNEQEQIALLRQELDLEKQRAERWKIAYEVLEDQANTNAMESARVYESLMFTVSQLLDKVNKLQDEKLYNSSKTVENSKVCV